MRKVLSVCLILSGLIACGCSGGSDSGGTPKVEGKVEVKDMPEGTSAPGDKRPTPADSGKTKETGARG
jgi:hypothetical protein